MDFIFSEGLVTESVLIDFIGFLIALVTAVVALKKINIEKLKVVQAEKEISFQRAALQFPDFIEEWAHIVEDITRLISETEIDRFIILRAWNGTLDPRWTTAVYQVREVDQTPVSYVHFELDNDYVARLREISLSNYIYFEVDKIPQSAIKDVYQSEGVTSAIWAHLHSAVLADSPSVAHTYCSFATHQGEIDQNTQTKCRILTGRLKGIANAFDSGENVN